MNAEQQLERLLSGQKVLPGVEPDPTEELETLDKSEDALKEQSSAAVSSVTLKNIFKNPASHPVVLDLVLLKKYGPEWYGWETETLQHHIPQEFGHEISELVLSKVQAVRTLHMVDFYWQQWEIFCWCTMPLNGVFPDFEVMQVPTVAQCMVSVDIANQLRDDVEWGSEVKAYLEVVHRHDGIFVPQAPLDFVHVDTDGLVVDPKEVQLLWPAVRSSDQMPKAETVTAEQLRRMLSAYRYLEDSRVNMRAQLPLVSNV